MRKYGSMQIILNKCYGGYGVSETAIKHCREKGADWAKWPNAMLPGECYPDSDIVCDTTYLCYGEDASRTCPHLIELVNSFYRQTDEPVDDPSGNHAVLKVINIPDDTPYEITEYDGIESIGVPRDIWG